MGYRMVRIVATLVLMLLVGGATAHRTCKDDVLLQDMLRDWELLQDQQRAIEHYQHYYLGCCWTDPQVDI